MDVSEEQLRLARGRVAEAEVVHAEFAELDLAAESFDAVTAFYSIVHVPRSEHETNRRLVREAGFDLLGDELVFVREPGDVESGWLWVLARRPW